MHRQTIILGTTMKRSAEIKIRPLLRSPLLALMLLGGNLAIPAERHEAQDEPERTPCELAALFVLNADRAEATSDYWLARARASNLPSADQRDAAKREAQKDLDEGMALAKEKYRARLELCDILDERRYHPVINPTDFLSPAEIASYPNPYFPLVPGTTYRYQGQTEEGTEVNEVRVTRDTKQILGVTTMVVRDIVWLDGILKEDTLDWYAQDRTGNVWYFGELTLSYENGELAGIEGSWEAGKEGGKPGIIMKAQPQVGDAYRQEFSPGVVEDAAKVLALNKSVTVPYGSFTNCLKTSEFTPIEPDSMDSPDNKFYAPGVGFVLEVKPATGERHELIAIESH
jgi:hypothetical protein